MLACMKSYWGTLNATTGMSLSHSQVCLTTELHNVWLIHSQTVLHFCYMDCIIIQNTLSKQTV